MVVSVQVGTQRFSIRETNRNDVGFDVEIVLGRVVHISPGMSRTEIIDFLKACRNVYNHIEGEIERTVTNGRDADV